MTTLFVKISHAKGEVRGFGLLIPYPVLEGRSDFRARESGPSTQSRTLTEVQSQGRDVLGVLREKFSGRGTVWSLGRKVGRAPRNPGVRRTEDTTRGRTGDTSDTRGHGPGLKRGPWNETPIQFLVCSSCDSSHPGDRAEQPPGFRRGHDH